MDLLRGRAITVALFLLLPACASRVGDGGGDGASGDASDAAPPDRCATYEHAWSTMSGAPARLVGLSGGDVAVAAGGPAFGNAMAGLVVARLDDAQQTLWSRAFANGYPWDIATNAAGEVGVTGTFTGTLDVDGFHFESMDTTGFVMVLGADGTARYARALPGFLPTSIALLDDGTLAIAGSQQGGADLGAGPLSSSGGLAVGRIDPAGAQTWTRDLTVGAVSNASAAVVAEPGGAVAVAFALLGTLDLGNGPLVSAGLSDVAVARFDTTGHAVASRRYGGPADDSHAGFNGNLLRAARGPDGALYVSTTVEGDVDFGDGLHTVQNSDAAVLALSPSLDLRWSRVLGGDGTDLAGTVAVRGDGVVGLTGLSENNTAPGPFACTGGIALPIVLLDPQGHDLYAACYLGNFAAGLSVAFAPDRVRVAGFASGALDLGGGALGTGTTMLFGFLANYHAACP